MDGFLSYPVIYFMIFWRLNTDQFIDVVRLAAYLESQGIGKNDCVAMFTSNSPEMVTIILALSKLSAVAGLVNTSLRGKNFPRMN